MTFGIFCGDRRDGGALRRIKWTPFNGWQGFIPDEDTGQIFAFTEGAQDISFDSMMAHQREAAAIVLKQPYVSSFMSSIGASNTSVVPNTGRFFIRLKPRAERPGVDEIIQELRAKLTGIPGFTVYPQKLPTIRIGANLTKAAYQYTLQDADTAHLYQWAPILQDRIRQLPGFLDVNSDLQITSPQVLVGRRDPHIGDGRQRRRSKPRSTTR